MEFSARYTLIGIFTLALCAGIFAFVYWLNNTGGFANRVEYRVKFQVPVSGLARGGNVLFNGLEVGEITDLYVDPENPANLVSVIWIDETVPVRADTVAGISYQGLTGAANILLTGGSPDAAPVVSDGIAPPMLVADPAASRSWTDNAGRVLGRIDDLFGQNKGRLDSILSGLEQLTGSGDVNSGSRTYDLKVGLIETIKATEIAWSLSVSEPTVVLSMNTEKVLVLLADGTWEPLPGAKWSDNLPNLFQAKLIQGFEDAGLAGSVLRPANSLDPDYTLVTDIRLFHIVAGDASHALVDVMGRILNRDGTVVATRRFETRIPVQSIGETQAVPALQTAFSKTAAGLIQWVTGTIN